jgi:RNA 2',3'-cyclic 3'-phosphodiesterase
MLFRVSEGVMDLYLSDGGRLFFAAVPDFEAAAKMHRLAAILRRAHGFRRKLILPERLHVSLLFLGRWSEPLARRACEAVARVRMTPFEVSFDRTASFRSGTGNRPLVLLGDETSDRLKSLGHMLGAAMMEKGRGRRAVKDFTPHVTLLYGERAIDEYPVEPIRWTVNEFVLIHSLQGHTHLARWRFDV